MFIIKIIEIYQIMIDIFNKYINLQNGVNFWLNNLFVTFN